MSEQSQSDDDAILIVNNGLILLSLDSVAARFDDLNISFLRPDLVKQAARDVLDGLKQFPKWGQPSGAMIRQLAGVLEQAGHGEDAKRAAAWLTRFLSVRKCEGMARNWGWVFLRFSPEYATVLRQLGMRDESVSLLGQLSDAWVDRFDEIETLGERIEQSVESEWDRAQYREYQQESDLVTPISFLRGWLRVEGFLRILRVIADRLEPQELKLFEAWARATAEVQTIVPESSLSLEHLHEILSSCSEE